MSLDFAEHKKDLIFIPLGGSNEIGLNLNLYHYQGKWLMVDCGGGFGDELTPGADAIIADYSFIKKYQKKLLALIVTHAHEDHIGAIQYVLEGINCPIYTTKFTANFLKLKLASVNTRDQIRIIDPNEEVNIKPFSITMISLTHSIPEMQAFVIKAGDQTVLHTGDWKFDPNPVTGDISDEKALESIKGVSAIVCDSTNVFSPGHSKSEGDLQESLMSLIAERKNLVVVTTFASNVARLKTLFIIASKLERKVVLIGRSLHRMFNVAKESGYLKNTPYMIHENEVANYKKHEVLVISTGCQGEPLAATAKMATKQHRSIRLSRGDTVIFSSKIIPGNEKKIFRIFNKLVDLGIDLITEVNNFVHVSGHPNIKDLEKMYQLTKPKVAIPVHGERVHIYEHCKLLNNWGIKAINVENGSVVKIDGEESKIIGKVKTGYLALDGTSLIDIESPIFDMRKQISYAGIAMATIVLNRNRTTLVAPVEITFPGCLDSKEDINLIDDIKAEILLLLKDKLRSRNSLGDLEKFVKSAIKRNIKNTIGKMPQIIVKLITLTERDKPVSKFSKNKNSNPHNEPRYY